MTKISNRKIAIMGVIAVLAIGIPAAFAPGLPQAVDELSLEFAGINLFIVEIDSRVTTIESAIAGIHQHSFVRADYIFGEVINNEQITAACGLDELSTGGGYALSDPGLRPIVVLPDTQTYSITVKGIATLNGSNAGVFVKCISLP